MGLQTSSSLSKRNRGRQAEQVLLAVILVVLLISVYQLFDLRKEQSLSRNQDLAVKLLKTRGEVQVRPRGTFVWKAVTPPATFSFGDALRTSSLAEAFLEAKDGQKFRVGSDSMVVFRRTENQNHFELMLGSVDADPPVRAPAGASTPQETTVKLWWLTPTEDEIWLHEESSHVLMMWGSSQNESFRLEVRSPDKILVNKNVSVPEYEWPTTPGVYDVQVALQSNPKISIKKTITVRELAPPRWQVAALKHSQALTELEWKNQIQGTSEVRLQRGAEVLWTQKLTAQQTSLPPEIQQKIGSGEAPTIAIVRTHRAGQTTRWSDPLVLQPHTVQIPIPGDLSSNKLLMRMGVAGTFECTPAASWSQKLSISEDSSISLRFQSESGSLASFEKSQPFPSPQICPPKPGRYKVQILVRNSKGLITHLSDFKNLEARLETPQFAPTIASTEDDSSFQFHLLRPAPYDIEVEWRRDEQTKALSRSLPSSPTLARAPEGLSPTQARLRYIEPNREAVSDWTPIQKLPRRFATLAQDTTTVRSPARAEEPHLLEIEPHDEGTLWLSRWVQTAWSEISWKPRDRATHYEVQVSATPDFTNIMIQKEIRTNRMLVPFQTKIPLFWRVRAQGETGLSGPWSKPQVLRVQAVNSETASTANESSPDLRHQRGRFPRVGDELGPTGSRNKPQDPAKQLP